MAAVVKIDGKSGRIWQSTLLACPLIWITISLCRKWEEVFSVIVTGNLVNTLISQSQCVVPIRSSRAMVYQLIWLPFHYPLTVVAIVCIFLAQSCLWLSCTSYTHTLRVYKKGAKHTNLKPLTVFPIQICIKHHTSIKPSFLFILLLFKGMS